jgi:hypothetical protein
LELALWLTFKGLQRYFKTLRALTCGHFKLGKIWKKLKPILYLTKPLLNLLDKEVQPNSTGIRYELKGWMKVSGIHGIISKRDNYSCIKMVTKLWEKLS